MTEKLRNKFIERQEIYVKKLKQLIELNYLDIDEQPIDIPTFIALSFIEINTFAEKVEEMINDEAIIMRIELKGENKNKFKIMKSTDKNIYINDIINNYDNLIFVIIYNKYKATIFDFFPVFDL